MSSALQRLYVRMLVTPSILGSVKYYVVFPLLQRVLYFNTFSPATLRELIMHKQNWSSGLRILPSLFWNIYNVKGAMNFKSSFKFKRLKVTSIFLTTYKTFFFKLLFLFFIKFSFRKQFWKGFEKIGPASASKNSHYLVLSYNTKADVNLTSQLLEKTLRFWCKLKSPICMTGVWSKQQNKRGNMNRDRYFQTQMLFPELLGLPCGGWEGSERAQVGLKSLERGLPSHRQATSSVWTVASGSAGLPLHFPRRLRIFGVRIFQIL